MLKAGDDVGHSGDEKKKKMPEWANSVKLNSFMLEFCRLGCV